MKRILFVAALAVSLAGFAGIASAQDFRGGYDRDGYAPRMDDRDGPRMDGRGGPRMDDRGGYASRMGGRGGFAPRIDARERFQEQRIRQGWRRGQLTPREYARLQFGERRIHGFENRARFDGRLGFAERGRLNRMENRESRMIFRLRHNGRCI